MWLCHYLCLSLRWSLRWLTGDVTNGARHDIPVLALPRADDEPCRTAGEPYPPEDKRISPLDRAYRGLAGKEKGPGSAFGPEFVPLATGSALRCLLGARALSTPNPLSSRISAAGPLSPLPIPRGIAPNLTSLVGPASEPGAGLSSNLPLIAAMSTTNLVSKPLTESI